MAQVKGLTVVVLTLAAVCLYATQTSAAASHACCTEFSRGRIPFHVIRGYSAQSVAEMCPINAIIFVTKKGEACADPALPWVKRHIIRLRKAINLRKTSG